MTLTPYNHCSALWQYSAFPLGGNPATLRQLALPRQFEYPAEIGFSEVGGVVRALAADRVPIYPYAFLWPLASDTFAVAYPAGTLAVAVSAGLPYTVSGPPSPPFGPPVTPAYSGTMNDGLETFWTTPSYSAGNVWPVPAVLPGGYTPRAQTPFRSGLNPQTYAFSYWTVSGVSSPPSRTDPTTGFSIPAWIPLAGCSILGDAASQLSGSVGSTTSGGITKWVFRIHNGVGLRKLQFQVAGSGSWTAKVSHFADGHDQDVGISASPGDADTIDFTTSGSGTSGWIDAGAISPTLGISSPFFLSVASAAGVGTIATRSSCRCDVPLPTTTPGLGDLVAPGGSVP